VLWKAVERVTWGCGYRHIRTGKWPAYWHLDEIVPAGLSCRHMPAVADLRWHQGVKENERRQRSPRRLLLLAFAFPPNPAPGSARAWRFYKYLPAFGYETHVITASAPDIARPRVKWVAPPPKHFNEKVLRKFFFPFDEDVSWTLPALSEARHLHAKTPFDVVLSTVPYIHDHIVALALKKEYGMPWIADYRDPIVGNPFRVHIGLSSGVDRFLDARFFHNADLLVAVTDRVRKEWLERFPEVESKSKVIWNGYDPEEVVAPKPLPERNFRLVAHYGNIYGSRTPAPAFRAAWRLIERGRLDPKSFRFRLIGSLDPGILANNSELFEHLVVAGCLELRPPVPRPQALDQMMHSDSFLLADNNGAGMGHTVPAKIFEYIRVGRPVLALTADHSAVEHILAMSGIRYVCMNEQMNAEECDARLLEFLRLPTTPVALTERFLTEFNGRDQARRLAEHIDDIIDRRYTHGRSVAEEDMNQLVES
jgi:glycosyltransferase involved in cell wall biosynthesis